MSPSPSREPLLYSPIWTTTHRSRQRRQDSRSRTGTYAAVILVEALVIAGLYLFGRYFSA